MHINVEILNCLLFIKRMVVEVFVHGNNIYPYIV